MSWENKDGVTSRLKLKSGLCKHCMHMLLDDTPPVDEFEAAGWRWCPIREDYVHDSMGCDQWKRVPLEVRLGFKKLERGIEC